MNTSVSLHISGHRTDLRTPIREHRIGSRAWATQARRYSDYRILPGCRFASGTSESLCHITECLRWLHYDCFLKRTLAELEDCLSSPSSSLESEVLCDSHNHVVPRAQWRGTEPLSLTDFHRPGCGLKYVLHCSGIGRRPWPNDLSIAPHHCGRKASRDGTISYVRGASALRRSCRGDLEMGEDGRSFS